MSTPAQVPLIPKRVESTAQSIVLQMPLQLTNQNAASPNYFGVRCMWQKDSQPFQLVTEDVVYVGAVEVDDPFNRERYLYYNGEEDTNDNDLDNQITNYSRVWEIHFCVYGPNSFDNARVIHSQLFKQLIHDLFANYQLYWVPDSVAPIRAPEYEDGQWWERTDFKARFNEFVTEVDTQPTILSTEIVVIENIVGQIADLKVEN